MIFCIFVKIAVNNEKKNFFNNIKNFLIESIFDNMNECSYNVEKQTFFDVLFLIYLHVFHIFSKISFFFFDFLFILIFYDFRYDVIQMISNFFVLFSKKFRFIVSLLSTTNCFNRF